MVWRGMGFIIFVIVLVVYMGAILISDLVVKKEGYLLSERWHLPLILFVSGAINFFLGRYLHSKPGKPGKDPKTGEEIMYMPLHTLYMIKIEYWGIILAISAIVVFLFSFK